MPTPLRYHDFTLRLQPDGGGGFTVLIQHAPAGGGSAAFRLAIPPESLARWRPGFHSLRSPEPGRDLKPDAGWSPPEMVPEDVGRTLFAGLFTDRVHDSFVGSMARAGSEPDRGLRLRLVFDPSAPGILPLAALPWELLYDPATRDFFARNRQTPVVRFLDVPRFTLPPPVEPPLRILVARANPVGPNPLDLEEEQRRIDVAWGAHPAVEVEHLPQATLEATRTRLRQSTFQILHFMGHGTFDAVTGEGSLLFEDDSGGEAPVPGPVLAEHLKGIGSLRLAVLNACRSAEMPRREGVDPYSGVASALVMSGLPAVVAMQLPISDDAALAFAEHLYQTLAEGGSIEAATAEGRLAIYREDSESFEWAVPALYLRTSEGSLLEGIVVEHPSPPAIRDKIRDATELIDEKTRGFVGRKFVFDEVERFLAKRDHGYFLLTGEPGIGKTALIAELVRCHGWVHHFNSRPAGIYRPEAFLENVCAQLIVAHRLGYASLPPEATGDGGFLSSLLEKTARKLGRNEKLVLLIDALDETDRDGLLAGVNPLYLPPALPTGVYAVVSSRPLRDEEAPTFTDPVFGLDLKHDSDQNLADIRELVESQLGRRGIREYMTAQALTETDFVEQMVKKSAGNFMYLSYVLPAIEDGAYRNRDLDDLPDGLERYYGDHWKRMRGSDPEVWLRQKLPVLGALTVIAEAVPFDLIAHLAGGIERRWVREVLQQWRPFLHLSEREDENGRSYTLYRIYHQSFHDFLIGKDEVADEQRVISEAERDVLSRAARREVDAMLEDLGRRGPSTNEAADSSMPESQGRPGEPGR